MKISEYDLLAEAFTRSFGFMLNRIVDVWQEDVGRWDPHESREKRERAEDLCFNEFMCALEEMGVELGTVGRDLIELQTRKSLPRLDEEE